MIVKNAFLRLALGAEISPTLAWPNLSGNHFLGTDITLTYPQATGVFSARLYFGEGNPTAVIKPTGDITVSALGTRQSMLYRVTAPSTGVTSEGSLSVTLKLGPGIQFTYLIPLNPTTHSNLGEIYKAIAAVLNASPDVTRRVSLSFNVAGEIVFTRLYPQANELIWFSITSLPGLGLLAGSSAAIDPGVAGMTVERLGPNTRDIYGDTLPGTKVKAWYLASPDYLINPGMVPVTSPQFGTVHLGGFSVLANPNFLVYNLSATGNLAILDVIGIQSN